MHKHKEQMEHINTHNDNIEYSLLIIKDANGKITREWSPSYEAIVIYHGEAHNLHEIVSKAKKYDKIKKKRGWYSEPSTDYVPNGRN